MITNGDVATWFYEAVFDELEKCCAESNIPKWYVVSELQQFSPSELGAIPEDRRFGVWIHATCESTDYRFFWDSLEQAISLFGTESPNPIAELHISRYHSEPELQHRIRLGVQQIVHSSVLPPSKNASD